MITVDRAVGPYVEPGAKLRVGHRNGMVLLSLGTKTEQVSTVQAIETCLALGKAVAKLEPGEHVVLTIGGESLHLPHEVALKVSGALLRKADAADDWQRLFH